MKKKLTLLLLLLIIPLIAYSEKTSDLDVKIEEGYYLIGNHCRWDITSALAFEHSSKDVYDDPVFTVVVTTTQADSYWKILPKSAVDAGSWDGQIGVEFDGDTATDGSLTDIDPQAGKIEEVGCYKFTINMMDGTYSYKELRQYIYLVGAPQGWDPSNPACALETKDFDNIYTGFVTLASGENNFFRFTTAIGDWDLVNYNALGSSENEENIELSAVDGVYSGSLIVGGPGNFCVPVDGEYRVTVNLTDMTVKIQEASEPVCIYTVGNINGWTTDGEADGAKAGLLESATNNGIYTGILDLPDSGDGNSYFRFYTDLVNDWTNGSIGTVSGGDEFVELDAEGIAKLEIKLGAQGAFKVPTGKYIFLVDTNESFVMIESDLNNSVDNIKEDAIIIKSTIDGISVSGASDGAAVKVCNLNGISVANGVTIDGYAQIELPSAKTIYIVIVEGKSYKVVR